MKVDSETSANKALTKIDKAMKSGDVNEAQFGAMIDEIPGTAQAYILGSEKADSLLGEVQPLETVGMNEYDVDYLRHTTDITDAELNAMPEMPNDNDINKAA